MKHICLALAVLAAAQTPAIQTPPTRPREALRSAIVIHDRASATSKVRYEADGVLFITFIAVALSTVGLYAVTAHGVAQRTQEIGVRMALGAQPRQVLAIVAGRVLLQLVLGLAAGLVCTLAWQRMFSTDRLDLSIMEPGALGAIAATLAVAALIACYIPARRAIHLDPVAAMRGD